MVSMTIKNL